MKTNQNKNHQKDLAIIGAGPSGLMAAISAAQNGYNVTIFERMPKPGKKLLITGGERCNITNLSSEEEFIKAFGREGRFITPALSALPANKLCQFFKEQGVPTHSTDKFHIFPLSNKSVDILKALENCCHKLNVNFKLNEQVTKIKTTNNQITALETNKTTYPLNNIILSSGGKSYPTLGSDGNGYQLAKKIGHSLISPVPALVPLKTAENWPKKCTGIVLNSVELSLELATSKKIKQTGILLFTHKGISGPLVLNLSGLISELLTIKVPLQIRLNFYPQLTTQKLDAHFNQYRNQKNKKHLRHILPSPLPKQIFDTLLKDFQQKHISQLSKQQQEQLIKQLTSTPLTVTATEGFQKAMVTKGGIPLKEINPKTLESKIIKGLYFAGEVINLDGPCGGYNLQWAFSSGYLAGMLA